MLTATTALELLEQFPSGADGYRFGALRSDGLLVSVFVVDARSRFGRWDLKVRGTVPGSAFAWVEAQRVMPWPLEGS